MRWRSRYEDGRGISYDDRDGYLAGHVPGAVFAGMIADLSDSQHPVPDMLIGPQDFARVMGRMGIGNDTLVIAYDNMGFPLGSARLWWALSYYGHDRVRVLDGVVGTDEAALTVLSLGMDQPCSTLSDIGRPRDVIRFSTRHFTSASTC